ncbi:PocR ligand-binding domain-containing protein [Kineothrix sp. MB12-C1]|uniref:PocR ligand-binding domain-containing protein n=1 Tax=Kineothrix sp. MB12-C1 TaxID=3070215 RepID=UPI0027D26962|nr:PocR ligand-binding domain-containing protein [Kineothrix sp. MB12-C1]WMC92339.1 PocR ligand-binding domain-containing protein [Kineothrix sp. MB12-C1]
MRANFSKIDQIVDPIKFQKIQDDIASATDLALITVDYKGTPLTRHSNCSDFCQKVRSSSYGIYCEKCDSHGGLEAARLRKPHIYICHFGLIDLAIPIIVNDLYIGAFMAGQVLLSPQDLKDAPEPILPGVQSKWESIGDDLKEDFDALPVMPLDKITALANMLLHIVNYCVEEAELKALIAHSEESLNRTYAESGKDGCLKLNTIRRHPKKETSQLIHPALVYIKKHPEEKITLEKMAALCNISPSYFSKLFAKENMGNLSDYVNKIRVELAKELLLNSDWNIRTIAAHIGYDDSGYFIKIFKKLTNKTPLEYRNDKENSI